LNIAESGGLLKRSTAPLLAPKRELRRDWLHDKSRVQLEPACAGPVDVRDAEEAGEALNSQPEEIENGLDDP
jgi:hypothetical protein